jgi:hypothetical protein
MVFDFLFEKKIKFDVKKKSNFLCMVFDVFLMRVKMMKTHNFELEYSFQNLKIFPQI